jgi:hypothetical protein
MRGTWGTRGSWIPAHSSRKSRDEWGTAVHFSSGEGGLLKRLFNGFDVDAYFEGVGATAED